MLGLVRITRNQLWMLVDLSSWEAGLKETHVQWKGLWLMITDDEKITFKKGTATRRKTFPFMALRDINLFVMRNYLKVKDKMYICRMHVV